MDETTASAIRTFDFSSVASSSSSSTSFPTTHVDAEPDHTRTIQLMSQIVFPAIIGFGCIGNLINIAVLTRRPMRMSTTNRYLTCLAVYDVLYLLFALSLIVKHYPTICSTCWGTVFYYAHVGRPLVDIWSNTGVWLTVTFTVERYICVSYPLKGMVWCTVRRANYIIVLVCALSAIITLPDFFTWTIVASGSSRLSTVGSQQNVRSPHKIWERQG